MSDMYFDIPTEFIGMRLDHWVHTQCVLTRSQFKKSVELGDVFFNNICVTKAGMKIMSAGKLYIKEQKIQFKPSAQLLDIVYEDDELLIVNKPSGMLVYPVKDMKEITLVNGLLAHTTLSNFAGDERPGIVHRIDRDTSGLVLVAKNNNIHKLLYTLLEKHEISREYIGIVEAACECKAGIIDLPITHDFTQGTKRKVDKENGKKARTYYQCVYTNGEYSLMRFKLETGRTHQIRVHTSALGHPLVGDAMYGHKKNIFGFQGQALHACSLKFIHPSTGEIIQTFGKAPDIFKRAVRRIKMT